MRWPEAYQQQYGITPEQYNLYRDWPDVESPLSFSLRWKEPEEHHEGMRAVRDEQST